MKRPFKIYGRKFWIFLLLAFISASGPGVALGEDRCAICGEEIQGEIYLMKDELTGQTEMVCSNCMMNLPRCYICGMPIKKGEELALPDGRYLCARDAKTVVINDDDARQICAGVKDDLDHLYSRFTSFPTNVDVAVIDRIDENSIFLVMGHDFESPDLLGVTEPVTVDGEKRYKIGLMAGLPQAELKETCAHEYSHTWVGENVSPERHARIARDAEEGFCEMMGYLLMDDQQEEAEKKRVLANHYTRGQVQLFIEAEQNYGFEDILDWMRYGVTSRLEEGHLDEVRDVKMPSARASTYVSPPVSSQITAARLPVTSPSVLKLEGIMWGTPAVAIINGHSFFLNDVNSVRLAGTNVTIQCVAIQHDQVRIRNLVSGNEQELVLPAN
jgi:hypothetical protein